MLALVFAPAGVCCPGFSSEGRDAARRQIDSELPHFVDQLAIAIEAGISFDAALTYLVDAGDGPLAEEIGRS